MNTPPLRPLNFRLQQIVLLVALVCPWFPAAAQFSAEPAIALEGSFNEFGFLNVFTPMQYHNGAIYVAYIQKVSTPATVTYGSVGKCDYADTRPALFVARKRNGKWESAMAVPYVSPDLLHNGPSLAVDAKGYIHVTYNMHNTPWQYVVSKRPEDITEWDNSGTQFAGCQAGAPTAALSGCKYPAACFKTWVAPGNAAIPGNQISYPRFHVDRKGVVFVSYREARYPDRPFYETQKSLGISRYSTETKTWQRVGNSQVFASDPDHVGLGTSVHFDSNNRMHVAWVYGRHYSQCRGSDEFMRFNNYAAYVYSDDSGKTFRTADGKAVSLPVTVAALRGTAGVALDAASWIKGVEPVPECIDQQPQPTNWNGYLERKTFVTVDAAGTPHVVVTPRHKDKAYSWAYVSFANGAWTSPQLLPGNAEMLLAWPQRAGAFVAIERSTWPKGRGGVQFSDDNGSTWERVIEFNDREIWLGALTVDARHFYATSELLLYGMAQNAGKAAIDDGVRVWRATLPLKAKNVQAAPEPVKAPAAPAPAKAPAVTAPAKAPTSTPVPPPAVEQPPASTKTKAKRPWKPRRLEPCDTNRKPQAAGDPVLDEQRRVRIGPVTGCLKDL